ncbi:MAG: hypothetical protein ICV63_16560 [Coleofasciculus sp. Co-bin14]|nr:hypothetical protein [Coleofasciculus sp. Co-bin14]
MNPAQIRQQGLEALVKALGPVGMVRFLHQFDTGSSDYTKERQQWLESLTLEDVLGEIRQEKVSQPTASPSDV